MMKIPVEASKKYEVLIGKNLLKDAGTLAAEVVVPCKVLIISDDQVAILYADAVEASFQKAGFAVKRYTFTHGEQSKNIYTLSSILEYAADNQFTRSDLFVALGGGITGDIAGFAAAVYQRGINYIQIPTTFLAAIDSSVGGKTAVNLVAGKNLAGAFWQPSLVICDYSTFETLPNEILADGTAEAIKYGMISDLSLFTTLESGLLEYEMEKVIARCINLKRRIVFQDEYDRGVRQLLNFGHTFGHAIEKCSGFAISHGHAVGIGMVMMTRASERLGITREKCSDRLTAVLQKHGLPVHCPFGVDDLISAVRSDKKRAGDLLTVVLPIRPGKCQLHPVPVGEIRRLIQLGLEQEES